MRVSYLGPEGTFSWEVALSSQRYAGWELIPSQGIHEAMNMVFSGEASEAVVPIENSIEGSVRETLDCLAFDFELMIRAEFFKNIEYVLAAGEEFNRSRRTVIASHAQALAQCRRKIREIFPEADLLETRSTAEAMELAFSDPSIAALGSKRAARIKKLAIIEENLCDVDLNVTRFVSVGREDSSKTGDDRTSTVCFIAKDRPGALLQILQEFAFRYINLTRIESRPTGESFGSYCFFIDMEGHREDEIVKDLFKCLNCKLHRVKVLGSYPKGAILD